MALIIDPDLLADSAADDGSQEIYINTTTKTIKAVIVGNLSTDGATLKCIYSFLKEQWRLDPHSKNLAAFPFPMTPITDENFELVEGWDFFNDATRYLVRTGGWTVRNTAGNVTQKWAGIVGLGTVGSGDQLYVQQVVGGASTNLQLTGQANQAIQVLRDDDGDGNFAEASDYDRRGYLSLFVREQAKTYNDANLVDIGVVSLDGAAYRFPLSNATDLKVATSDVTIAASSPWTQINIKFFDQAFAVAIDTPGTPRNFGIAIDVGTHSGVDGSFSNGGAVLTTAEGAITGANYIGGTLIVHEGAAAGTYTISGTPTATTVTITGTFPAVGTNVSFSLQRATPIVATAEQIYEKVQYQLRQVTDIDATDQSVIGKTADLLLEFVGDTLKAGSFNPTNPNGGGSGVVVIGFSTNDTNRLTFRDNSAVDRTYPFVATLTIQFGANLQADASAKYWVYFTTLPGGGNDFGEAGALIVDDNSAADMTGNVSGAPSVTKTFNYDGNSQGGRTPGTDAAITVVALGLATGQYVRTAATISRSTSNVASLAAALERNYANP